MRLQELDASLSRGIAPIYFIAGEETLLVEEAGDAVCNAAQAAGFSERETIFTEANFDWSSLHAEASNTSLFASQRILDVRLSAKHIGRDGGAFLRDYCAAPSPDILLLLRCDALDYKQTKTAWYKAVDAAGVAISLFPMSIAEFPRWLRERTRRYSLELDTEAFDYLVERAEGNLLAADQALQRVALLAGSNMIDLAAAQGAVEDATHYDTFKLLDAVFARDVERVPRMLKSLREEGATTFGIAASFAYQLRSAGNLSRMTQTRRRVMEPFVRRVGQAGLDRLLAECALLDQQSKGDLDGEAWVSLERLLLGASGLRTTPGLGQSRADLQRFELFEQGL
ncbi:MAG: DNA polymerase III subunit delta [Pseudomonadaceae bacterium]|nr:DNA polymerase III subunit delta [Pseudomonadaceae bacterium]